MSTPEMGCVTEFFHELDNHPGRVSPDDSGYREFLRRAAGVLDPERAADRTAGV